jgi:hypothetical protein
LTNRPNRVFNTHLPPVLTTQRGLLDRGGQAPTRCWRTLIASRLTQPSRGDLWITGRSLTQVLCQEEPPSGTGAVGADPSRTTSMFHAQPLPAAQVAQRVREAVHLIPRLALRPYQTRSLRLATTQSGEEPLATIKVLGRSRRRSASGESDRRFEIKGQQHNDRQPRRTGRSQEVIAPGPGSPHRLPTRPPASQRQRQTTYWCPTRLRGTSPVGGPGSARRFVDEGSDRGDPRRCRSSRRR